jgi:hypothetical protein
MNGTPFRCGPVALTTTMTTNILNPPTTTGGVGAGTPKPVIVLYKLRVVNKTGSASTFSLWLGATGANTAGTEVATARSVPANSEVVIDCYLKLTTSDFLVGGAADATTLTFIAEGKIGVEYQ